MNFSGLTALFGQTGFSQTEFGQTGAAANGLSGFVASGGGASGQNGAGDFATLLAAVQTAMAGASAAPVLTPPDHGGDTPPWVNAPLTAAAQAPALTNANEASKQPYQGLNGVLLIKDVLIKDGLIKDGLIKNGQTTPQPLGQVLRQNPSLVQAIKAALATVSGAALADGGEQADETADATEAALQTAPAELDGRDALALLRAVLGDAGYSILDASLPAPAVDLSARAQAALGSEQIALPLPGGTPGAASTEGTSLTATTAPPPSADGAPNTPNLTLGDPGASDTVPLASETPPTNPRAEQPGGLSEAIRAAAMATVDGKPAPAAASTTPEPAAALPERPDTRRGDPERRLPFAVTDNGKTGREQTSGKTSQTGATASTNAGSAAATPVTERSTGAPTPERAALSTAALGSGSIDPSDAALPTSFSPGATATAAALGAGRTFAAQTPWAPTDTYVAGQVALQISRAVKDGSDSFRLRLDPPELGRVDVKLEISHDGRVSAVVAVDNDKTLQLLLRDQGLLERALQDAGLKTDSGSLSFSMNSEGSQNGQSLADSGREARKNGRTAGRGGDDTAANPLATRLVLSDRALDIRV